MLLYKIDNGMEFLTQFDNFDVINLPILNAIRHLCLKINNKPKKNTK